MGSAHFALWEAGVFAGLMFLLVGFLWSRMNVSRYEGATLFALGLAWYFVGGFA
jgi:hypothetical protein